MPEKHSGNIVLDTNTIAYFFLPGPFEAKAKKFQVRPFEWIVPKLWRSEFLNVLAVQMRHSKMPLDQAMAIFSLADEMMREGEREVSARSILSLVDQCSCSAYDCEFIALAQHLKTRLVTQDKKLLREFPDVAVSIVDALKLK